jgi:hypothetical protein
MEITDRLLGFEYFKMDYTSVAITNSTTVPGFDGEKTAVGGWLDIVQPIIVMPGVQLVLAFMYVDPPTSHCQF